MIITQIVQDYDREFTESTLHINGQTRFCYVLEDPKQLRGVKIAGKTCIPEGCYEVSITTSARWEKPMMILHNAPDFSVDRDGIRFTGIRPHGGNDVDDTDGCPLCAYESNHTGAVWRRASDDLFDIVQAAINRGEKVLWVKTSH